MNNARILLAITAGSLAGAIAVGSVGTWDEAEGRVVSSQVRELGDGWYRPDVRYTYTWDGRAYEGRLVVAEDALGTQDARYASDTTDPVEAEARVGALRPGAAVPVYVNPANPAQAVLERSGTGKTWVLAGIGFSTLIGALVVLTRKPA